MAGELSQVVLGIDTAGPVIGAALIGAPGEAGRRWSARAVRGSDALLTPAVASLLREVDGVDLVAVSVGPGGFTSLRVGVATALGVAFAQGCEVVGVSSLRARALSARAAGVDAPLVLSMLDARKGRAYAALFGVEGRLSEELDLPPEQAVALAGGQPFVATGEGALRWRELVEAAGGEVHPGAEASPALTVAEVGAREAHRAVAPEALRLNYIRPSDAVPPRR